MANVGLFSMVIAHLPKLASFCNFRGWLGGGVAGSKKAARSPTKIFATSGCERRNQQP